MSFRPWVRGTGYACLAALVLDNWGEPRFTKVLLAVIIAGGLLLSSPHLRSDGGVK